MQHFVAGVDVKMSTMMCALMMNVANAKRLSERATVPNVSNVDTRYAKFVSRVTRTDTMLSAVISVKGYLGPKRRRSNVEYVQCCVVKFVSQSTTTPNAPTKN
jgi:hypothetical protein